MDTTQKKERKRDKKFEDLEWHTNAILGVKNRLENLIKAPRLHASEERVTFRGLADMLTTHVKHIRAIIKKMEKENG